MELVLPEVKENETKHEYLSRCIQLLGRDFSISRITNAVNNLEIWTQ